MNKDKKVILIEDLRADFRQYIENEYSYLKDKKVVLSDAFYINRHELGIGFCESLENQATLELSKEKIKTYLIDIRKVKNPESGSRLYLRSINILKEFIDKTYGGIGNLSIKGSNDFQIKNDEIKEVPKPSVKEIEEYLNTWDNSDSYTLQENALEKLFFRTYPKNTDIENVLIKVSVLNDFYSTNIYSPFTVAKHIVNLNIDKRLEENDISLIEDIGKVEMNNGKVINFYSFATKYCSHHKPLEFPIYDSYVDKVLMHFKKVDKFYEFKKSQLREYKFFKEVLINFRKYYNLEKYSLKDIDKYLWQLGKEYFLNKY